MTISRIVPCLFALVPALAGGSSADDANPDAAESHEPIVHEAGTVVEFHRKCADAEPYRVEAYAALHSEGDRARALATIYARRDAVRREEVFLGMRIVALQLQAGPEWAD
ncbi:MAG: hypothetical protein OXP28_10320, partial [Gammaproteobacteria bacterium]|nr:hypothetical protein [Gammaproteobacteria bacterium]